MNTEQERAEFGAWWDEEGCHLGDISDRAAMFAAKQHAEPRLDAPAQVGHTRFGEGVPWSTVIGAAQRYHAAQNTPAKEQERIKRAAENIKAIHQAEPVKVPSDHYEQIAGVRTRRVYHGTPEHEDYIKTRFNGCPGSSGRIHFLWDRGIWNYLRTVSDETGVYELLVSPDPRPTGAAHE